MAANRISLASGVVPEFGPLETISAAAGGGFDAVGLWIEPPAWTPQLTQEVKSRLSGSGLELLDVEVVWLKPGPADRAHFRASTSAWSSARRMCWWSARIPTWAPTRRNFGNWCVHAEPAGMRVSLEFGLFTEIKAIGQALAVIAAAIIPPPLC